MYECPRCNPGSRINTANLRKLRAQDLENIKKLFKQIQVSWEFLCNLTKLNILLAERPGVAHGKKIFGKK